MLNYIIILLPTTLGFHNILHINKGTQRSITRFKYLSNVRIISQFIRHQTKKKNGLGSRKKS